MDFQKGGQLELLVDANGFIDRGVMVTMAGGHKYEARDEGFMMLQVDWSASSGPLGHMLPTRHIGQALPLVPFRTPAAAPPILNGWRPLAAAPLVLTGWRPLAAPRATPGGGTADFGDFAHWYPLRVRNALWNDD